MLFLWIGLGVLLFLLAAVLITAYVCYRMAFYEANPPRQDENQVEIPKGRIYEPFREKMVNWTLQTRQMPHEDIQITSFDGLPLCGKFYEFQPGAPIELMFHGYRGSAERDLSGGVQRCFKLGRSTLIVDQRCSGGSGGHVITFGIREHRDCLTWVHYLAERFGPEVKILMTGISMGATTVLMAAGRELPANVIGVIADCGFSSAKQIIQKVIADMKLPPRLAYPFVRLGARLYGGFDLEEYSALEAMQTCRVPVLFFHGEDDDFVPCDMSRAMYAACQSRKQLVTVPGAGHGLSYPIAPELYLPAARGFFGQEGTALQME